MAKKTKILFISHSPYWYGAERCLYELVKGIDREKYEPLVAIPGEDRLNEKLDQLAIPLAAVKLERWVTFKKEDHLALWRFRHDLRERVGALVELIRREAIDVVYSNTCVITAGALAARLAGVPHVWHIHEMLGVNPDLVPFINLRSFFPLVDGLSTRIVAVSRSVQAQIEKYAPGCRIELIYNGVEAANGELADPGEGVPWTRPDAASPVVIFVGALSQNKGVLTLIDAAPLVLTKHPQAQFLLVGRHSAIYQTVQSRLKERRVEHAFHLPGFCKNAAQLIADADLLVLPSEADSFPSVVMEAMAAGKPVVATRSGGAEEMVVDGETGYLIPTRDAGALARSVVALIDDPHKARAMGQRGRARVEALFSQEQYLKNFQRLFDEAQATAVPVPPEDLIGDFLAVLDANLDEHLKVSDPWKVMDEHLRRIDEQWKWLGKLQEWIQKQQKTINQQNGKIAELETFQARIQNNLFYRALRWIKRGGRR